MHFALREGDGVSDRAQSRPSGIDIPEQLDRFIRVAVDRNAGRLQQDGESAGRVLGSVPSGRG